MHRIFVLLAAAGMAIAASSAPTIANFHQVDANLYRGGQPLAGEFQSLAGMGIKTIVDLRDEPDHIQAERKLVESAGMHYVSIPMNGLVAPSDLQIARALAAIENHSDGPVFVHCRRGADRTGTVIACYRVGHDGWSNQKALQEAYSFGMSWIERGMRSYVLRYHAAVPSAASAVTVQ